MAVYNQLNTVRATLISQRQLAELISQSLWANDINIYRNIFIRKKNGANVCSRLVGQHSDADFILKRLCLCPSHHVRCPRMERSYKRIKNSAGGQSKICDLELGSPGGRGSFSAKW